MKLEEQIRQAIRLRQMALTTEASYVVVPKICAVFRAWTASSRHGGAGSGGVSDPFGRSRECGAVHPESGAECSGLPAS